MIKKKLILDEENKIKENDKTISNIRKYFNNSTDKIDSYKFDTQKNPELNLPRGRKLKQKINTINYDNSVFSICERKKKLENKSIFKKINIF